jgi:anti-anti-sigma factor
MDELEPQRAGPLEFDVAEDPRGDVLVTLGGELDLTAVDALHERVAPLLERRPRALIVDVAGLRFADSSAIALWVRWAALAQRFELRDPQPLLRRIIEAMGLADKLAVTP